jgi:misacylated tRNA(Ala) deacylase
MHGGTELLYLDDSYLKNCEAVVVKVLDRGVVLDRTCFHPRGGGLVSDTGVLTHDKGEARVRGGFVCGGRCSTCFGGIKTI